MLPVGLGVAWLEGGVVDGFVASAVEGGVVVFHGFHIVSVGALGQPQPMLVVWQPEADSSSPLASMSRTSLSCDNVLRMIESLLRHCSEDQYRGACPGGFHLILDASCVQVPVYRLIRLGYWSQSNQIPTL
jgi:hypothetical protein